MIFGSGTEVWRRRIRLAKAFGALLLILSLFLPMSSCTTPQPMTKDANGVERTEPAKTEYHYVWKFENADQVGSYVLLLGWLWPSAVVLLASRLGRRAQMAVFAIEPLLFAATSYFCFGFAMFGHLEIGLYVTVVGMTAYGLAWLAELGLKVRFLINRRIAPLHR